MTAREYTATDEPDSPPSDALELHHTEPGTVTLIPADASEVERAEAWLSVSESVCCELGRWR
ncbi:hypothetical protein C483_17158 [Natrialba hulunbeirensis JCM 10989]|uniref:DUF7511 domain-containing protein n=1 Tax=Natrialba hulunbeirensis JCM 10989 TaxID=1227493 RepID=L9ZMR6_9EURY|nr:hypothetical protein [Natrialba hulunbeirensis]ELY87649.1 hypothetical protein C483_17158 [Natrialba hulunbeirensis JCM 10989]